MNKCPACGMANSESARFCAQCGNSLSLGVGAEPDYDALLQAEIDPIRDRLAEKYQIMRFIGRGGFSTVFLVKDRALERFCALKILSHEQTIHPESVERFKREARLYASLDHPNIVSVYDFGFHNHVAYIIFKYIDGITLHEHIKRCHPLAQVEILSIASDLADILDYMHRHGVIHRDVKPDNIMVQNADRKVILTDFGLAKKLDTSTVTSDGKVMGSPHYFSPEQAKGEQVDARSDIYSLGITIFEMASGIVPFKGDTPYEVILKHIREPLPDLSRLRPDLHPDLHKMIRRCSEKEPCKRFQDASELKAALRRVPAPSLGTRTEIIHRVPFSEARRLWLAVFAAAAALIVAGSFWIRNQGIRLADKSTEQTRQATRATFKKRVTPSGEAAPGQTLEGGDSRADGQSSAPAPAEEKKLEKVERTTAAQPGTESKRQLPIPDRGLRDLNAEEGLPGPASAPPAHEAAGADNKDTVRGSAVLDAKKNESASRPQTVGDAAARKSDEKVKNAPFPAQVISTEKAKGIETALILDLSSALVQGYIKELALLSAGPLAGEFKASGAVVLVLRIDEAGHVGLEAMNDADVRVEPASRRREILELVRSRINGIKVQPPVSKAGNAVRVANWRVSLRVGRDRQMLILWRSG